jgi:hypothetical protein
VHRLRLFALRLTPAIRGMRTCRQCGVSLGRFVEECPRCGADNPVRLPWYGWVVGGILVLALFLAFGDIGALVGLIERLAGFGR